MSDFSSRRLELTPEERQAKLERQKQVMEQRRKQRQAQSGMIMSSGLHRPMSNKYPRPSSRASGQPTRMAKTPDRPVVVSSSASALWTETTGSASCEVGIPRELGIQTEEKPATSTGNADAVAQKLAALGLSSVSNYNESDSSSEEIEPDPPTCMSTVSSSPNHGIAIAPTSISATAKPPLGAYKPNNEEASPPDTASALDRNHDGSAKNEALLDIRLTDQSIDNLQELVFQTPPESAVMKCRITRDKHGLDRHMYPIYYLHLEWDAGTKLFLLVGRKRKRSRSSNYIISINAADLTRDGSNYVAKLRSNFVGTAFTLYDRGANPSRRSTLSSSVREELCMIHYDTNVLGFKGPRKMDVVIPRVDEDRKRHSVKPTRDQETLLERFKFTQMRHLLHLYNKQPIWSEETQAYVLNFHGRVTQASVKNFQLIHESDPDYIVMQFGRISDDCFTMDFRYPMCAVQAFAIALSSFDSKLACE